MQSAERATILSTHTSLSDHDPKRWLQWLDGVDAATSMLYVVLLAVIAGGVLGALFYAVTHWPVGFGWGSQGEGFYLGVAFLLVIGWVMGQLTWIMRRRRRQSWTFDDNSEIPLPKIDVRDSGFSIQWGQPDRAPTKRGSRTWSWNLPVSSSSMQTFRLDQPALDAARQAREVGRSWDDVCRMVNPEWETMNMLDRALYQRALEAAVQQPRHVAPPGSEGH